jgi:hypothetical protein
MLRFPSISADEILTPDEYQKLPPRPPVSGNNGDAPVRAHSLVRLRLPFSSLHSKNRLIGDFLGFHTRSATNRPPGGFSRPVSTCQLPRGKTVGVILSGGAIYGADAGDASKNTASGYGYGHAVYVSPGWKRNFTVGEGVTLNSKTSGAAGGWEETAR